MKKFKIGLLCLAVSLVCFNLCSCGRGQNKLIEVGFEVNEGNGIARPFESGFETKIRVDTKKESEKQLEIFYGNRYSDCWSLFSFSEKQTITFTLKRAIVAKENSKVVFEDEILSFDKQIFYFFSEDFSSKTNYLIDNVSHDQLLEKAPEGYIRYSFTLEPKDGEILPTVYVNDNETNFGKYDNFIECYDARAVGYVLENGGISFVPSVEKEDINE